MLEANTHTRSRCHVYSCLLSVPIHQAFTVTNLCEKNLQVCIFLPPADCIFVLPALLLIKLFMQAAGEHQGEEGAQSGQGERIQRR